MSAQRFRKKPVVIEAIRFVEDGSNWRECCAFIGADTHYDDDLEAPDFLYIETLEGMMEVSLGDWIIRGVQGEFYPCKPDIFEATYEQAAADASGEDAFPRGERGD